jgi:hypothetical protein
MLLAPERHEGRLDPMAKRLKPMNPRVAGGAKSDQETRFMKPRAGGDGRRVSPQSHRRGSGGGGNGPLSNNNASTIPSKTAEGCRRGRRAGSGRRRLAAGSGPNPARLHELTQRKASAIQRKAQHSRMGRRVIARHLPLLMKPKNVDTVFGIKYSGRGEAERGALPGPAQRSFSR